MTPKLHALRLEGVAENRLLAVWASRLSRHPEQLNRPHEADAELIALPGLDALLAVSVDTIAEEIALGLYRTPETVGWVAAVASLSDLAAVGARPLGVLVAVTLPHRDAKFQEGVAAGLEAACRAHGTYVLGGDTNFASQAALSCTAIGLVAQGEVLRRTGARPGDLLYASGRLGAGALPVARARFGAPGDPAADYRPLARLPEAGVLRGFATACMDTSDGLIATLDQLARLNGVGFALTAPLETLLTPEAGELCARYDLAPLLLLTQPHGEFELVFTIPVGERARFEAQARAVNIAPILIGEVSALSGVYLQGRAVPLDTARLRDLAFAGGGLARLHEDLLRAIGDAP